MPSERGIFLVMFIVFIFNGSDACFTANTQETLSVETGRSVYKECQCDPDSGYTTSNLHWRNHHDMIIQLASGPGTNARIYAEEQDGTSLNLHIPNITKAMSGTYKCVAYLNGKIYTQSYKVIAYDPLYFYDTPIDQHLIYGKTSSIKCQPKSTFDVYIEWYKGNEKEEQIHISSNEKYEEKSDELVIYNVTENDAGTYKCSARVPVTSEDVDEYITVKVMTEPEIQRIKSNPDNTTVVAGQNLTIECIADGIPHPEYFWNKTLTTGAAEANITLHQEINALIFDYIRPEDSGVYTCYAYNEAGTSMTDITVEVLVPPYMSTPFLNITAVEDTAVKLICNVIGKPEPDIYIIYGGKELYEDLNEIESDESNFLPNMHVMSVNHTKEGYYYCNAYNEVGMVQEKMYLTVLHRPYIIGDESEGVWGWEGKTLNLTCDNDSNPPATVTWRFQGNNILAEEEAEVNRKILSKLKNVTETYFTMTIDNETAYGTYECIAKNVYGEARKRIILIQGFKPGHIKSFSMGDPTATSVTFNMEGPDFVQGPEIVGFTASYDEVKNYEITDIHVNRTWECSKDANYKLDKLKSNTTYRIKFAAVNEVGAGMWSNFSEFTTLDKSIPEPPEWDEEPITLSRNSHVLRWRAPDDNGEPIDHYELMYCSEDGDNSCKNVRIDKGTELELMDLEFNSTYFLDLKAHNSEGYSLSANISALVPAPPLTSLTTLLSGGAIIGISIVIVLVCLLLLDVLFLVWRRQGLIAMCCYKKDNKRKESPLNSRDKKGLLNGESEDRADSARNNGHKEFQYNKNTGVVTGKHSAV